MELRRLELIGVRIPLRSAFAHARHSRAASEALLVVAEDAGGRTGLGEIQPRSYVTGETLEAVQAEWAPAFAARWLGVRLSSFEEARSFLEAELAWAGRRLATFAGFELALLDLLGQGLGASAAAILGAPIQGPLPAGVIVGFEIPTEGLKRHATQLRFGRRRHVKVKIGRSDDAERLQILASVLGPEVPLRLDANGCYGVAEAIAAVQSFEGVPIHSLEEPVTPGDLAGMRAVREATGVKVMADESLVTFADAEALISARAADIFNLRLGKNGGLWATGRLAELAASAGLEVHLGTMVGETGILSQAAELFGRRVPGLSCLDGKGQNRHLLEADVVSPVPFEDEAPGLGVQIADESLPKYALGERRAWP